MEQDPKFAAAYGWAARSYSQLKSMNVEFDVEEVAETERLARMATELGWDDAVALSTEAIALAYVAGDLEGASTLTERAIAINPNVVWAWHFSGWVKLLQGEPEAAIEHHLRLASSLS